MVFINYIFYLFTEMILWWFPTTKLLVTKTFKKKTYIYTHTSTFFVDIKTTKKYNKIIIKYYYKVLLQILLL